MSFIVFLVRLVEKRPKIEKFGQNVEGPTQRSSDPRSGEGPHREEGFLGRSMVGRVPWPFSGSSR